MSKKKKKFDKKNVSPQEIEKQAIQALTQQQFVKANQLFTNLYHKNPNHYRPKLLESYDALFQDALKKGNLSEAKNILSKRKQISGSEVVGYQEWILAVKTKKYSEAVHIYILCLSAQKECSEITNTPEFADTFILSFCDFPQLETFAPQIASETKKIVQALEKISQEDYQNAWENVKEIGTNSLFSHWKLFIKGLIAFYQKDEEKARFAFERVASSKTLLKNSANAYLCGLKGNPPPQKAVESAWKQICFLLGKEASSTILQKANTLWNAEKYLDSYKEIRNLSSFPNEDSSLEGLLTRFYFNSIFHLPKTDSERYLHQLYKIFVSPTKNTLETLLIRRAKCLFEKKRFENEHEYTTLWENFLKNYHLTTTKTNPQIDSLVYFELGNAFAEIEESDTLPSLFFQRRQKKSSLRNGKLAEQYLKKSIKFDPNHKESYLVLLEVYQEEKQSSPANKLLDQMISLFPEDVDISKKAGVSCLERKAYIKAIKYLETAYQLNPLDTETKQALIVSYYKAAQNYFQKKQLGKGRELYQKIIPLTETRSDHPILGRMYLYARWSSLEFSQNQEKEGQEKEQYLRQEPEHLFKYLYFLLLAYQHYRIPTPIWTRIEKETTQEWKKEPTIQKIVLRLTALNYFLEANKKQKWFLAEEARWTKDAKSVSTQSCSRDEAKKIIAYCFQGEMSQEKLGVAKIYIAKKLAEDKLDPIFMHLDLTLPYMIDRFYFPKQEDIKKLQKILELAEQRNETDLVSFIKKQLSQFEKSLEMEEHFKKAFDSNPFLNPEEYWDDDDDDDDDDNWKEEGEEFENFLDRLIDVFEEDFHKKKK